MQNHKNVIRFPEARQGEPERWTFFDFVDGGGNRIEEWYRGQSEDAQQQLDALLKLLRKTSNHLQWTGFKFLKGEPKEERIWQLDFIADRRQYRMLGVFGQGRKRAALLVGCYHKGPRYTPPGAMNMAIRRAKELKTGRARLYERQGRDDL